MPVEAFDPARLLQARVDNRARVSVRQCYLIPIGALARYDRPAPTLGAYDSLLTGSGT